jgi:MraZ protein
MVFFGEYNVTFTGNGRVVLPKKIRELISSHIFVLAKGFDDCLQGFTKEDFEERSRELLQISLLDKTNLDKRRALFASTTYVEADSQGRFVIPKHLLDYAHLEAEELQIIGAGDHFEIWNKSMWQAYLHTTQ